MADASVEYRFPIKKIPGRFMPDSPDQTQPDDHAGLNEARGVELATHLEFLGLTDEDAVRLRSLLPLFRETGAEYSDQFYEHLLRFDETARFLADAEMIKRLKALQQEHFQSLLAAVWDEEFVERRRRVGEAHAERGIDHLFFLTAYSRFLEHFAQGAATDREETTSPAMMSSLSKAIFLDIALTLESYFSGLTNDLRQALDVIWRANAQLRQFARLASHDLKTPLGTVSNLCEEVLDEFRDDIPDEAAELIEAARRTAFRMGETIDELLRSSLSEETGWQDDVASGEEILQEAVERLRPALVKKDISVVMPESVPWVRGNKAQIREAFYNIFSNAEKYIDRKPGQIDVEVELQESSCLFSIRDNGPGIPEKELEQIFTAFHRLPEARRQPGSGLGLYFAKNLIEQQGGRIWAESEPGHGSSFRILLRRSLDSDNDSTE